MNNSSRHRGLWMRRVSRRSSQVGWALVILVVMGLAPQAGAQPVRLPMFEPDFLSFLQDDPAPPRITGPIDTRFFGNFCQAQPKTYCKSIPLWPDPCVTLSNTKIHLDHITTPAGGQLTGSGTFRLDGDQGALTLAGRTVGKVRFLSYEVSGARLVASAPGLGTMMGFGYLSNDGVSLSTQVQGRTLVLRKDACGNNPPTVGVSALSGPTFPYGTTVHLLGSISDEDTSFPVERMVYRSNRQGVLQGWRFGGGRNLSVSTLVPGPHLITFTVTDSGGLTRSASVSINILNRPPTMPTIFLPAEGATLVAGAGFKLQGTAFTFNGTRLFGSALRWTAQTVPGGPFVLLGTGSELTRSFSQPGTPLTIRLTATDSTGLSSFAERSVTVLPAGGNSPPIALIRSPDRVLVNGGAIAGLYSFEPFSLQGFVSDAETAAANLQIEWHLVAITELGGAVIPMPQVPNPAPITGTLSPTFNFHPQAEGYYRVILRVTDSDGWTSTDTIEVWTQPNQIG